MNYYLWNRRNRGKSFIIKQLLNIKSNFWKQKPKQKNDTNSVPLTRLRIPHAGAPASSTGVFPKLCIFCTGLWQMFITFVLRCDWSILRILKSTKKHEQQSESEHFCLFITIFFDSTTINTWFIKLIGGKDLQSYTHIDLSEIRALFNA